MKQQHISTFCTRIIYGVLFSFAFTINAQNDTIVKPVKTNKTYYALRVGTDIGKLIRTSVQDHYKAFEIIGDFRIKKNTYLSGELGFEEFTTDNNFLNITTTGSYLKIGVDQNLYENWLNMDNLIYTGGRLAFSQFKHDLNRFTIYNTNQYWEQLTSNTQETFNNLNAFWVEAILGIKVEVLKSLYLGLNVQLKILALETDIENFDTLYIPGFEKRSDNSRLNWGFGYTIAYKIPFSKK